MRLTRIWKLVFGIGLAMALMTGNAHASVTWTLSDYHASAYANSTTDTTYGSFIATDSTTTLPSGWKVAHADNATSPFGANSPNNGDTVATGTAIAKWAPFCTHSTLTLTGKWVEPIDSGAPANTVAQINMQSTIFTTKVFITLTSGIYKIVTPSMPSAFVCSSTTDGETVITVDGTVSGTSRHVTQNTSTTGTATATTVWHDTAGGTHNDSASVTII
jgi:hypothetical protein